MGCPITVGLDHNALPFQENIEMKTALIDENMVVIVVVNNDDVTLFNELKIEHGYEYASIGPARECEVGWSYDPEVGDFHDKHPERQVWP